jgi:GxxExxY protein
MAEIILKEESYKIVSACTEVHKNLGAGFKEIIYKDAFEIEFKRLGILFSREKKFKIQYKGITLPHHYFADFIVYDSIILEVRSTPFIIDVFVAQTINYLKASGFKLGIIANFGEKSLAYKRVVF